MNILNFHYYRQFIRMFKLQRKKNLHNENNFIENYKRPKLAILSNCEVKESL